jgi:hypothetical protein
MLACFAQNAGFEHGLGHFLDKQRYALRRHEDLPRHCLGQGLAAGNALHQQLRVIVGQARELHCRDMGVPGPGRRKFRIGTQRNQHEHPQAGESLDQQCQKFERGRVDPLKVLGHDQQRPARCQTLGSCQQSGKNLLLAPLWRDLGEIPSRFIRQRQEIGR